MCTYTRSFIMFIDVSYLIKKSTFLSSWSLIQCWWIADKMTAATWQWRKEMSACSICEDLSPKNKEQRTYIQNHTLNTYLDDTFNIDLDRFQRPWNKNNVSAPTCTVWYRQCQCQRQDLFGRVRIDGKISSTFCFHLLIILLRARSYFHPMVMVECETQFLTGRLFRVANSLMEMFDCSWNTTNNWIVVTYMPSYHNRKILKSSVVRCCVLSPSTTFLISSACHTVACRTLAELTKFQSC
jgi:hypothetical protein